MALLIKNAIIVTGGKRMPGRQDILVQKDVISAIGNFGNKKADEVIDAAGAFVFPGFIDVHNDADHYLGIFDGTGQEYFIRQGVTTAVGGNSGVSLAPLLYGDLSVFEQWGDTNLTNIDWHSMKEFLARCASLKLGFNFATMTGHTTVRAAIAGDAARPLTKNEAAICQSVLRRSVREGSCGVSFGLCEFHEHPQNDLSEIVSAVAAVRSRNSVAAVAIRQNGPHFLECVTELFNIRDKLPKTLIVSRFVASRENRSFVEAAIRKFYEIPTPERPYFTCHMLPVNTFSFRSLLPTWLKEESDNVVLAKLADMWFQKRVIAEFPDLQWEKVGIAHLPRNEYLVGRKITELQKEYLAGSPKEVLVRLMLVSELRGTLSYRNVDDQLQRSLVADGNCLIGSCSADYLRHVTSRGPGVPENGSFGRFFAIAVGERLLSFEEAVSRLTMLPAKLFGLTRRGEIKEGFYADLVVWEGGVRDVIVNGMITVREKAMTTARNGRPVLTFHGT